MYYAFNYVPHCRTHTFFLMQHTERLQQLMLSTFHHAQPRLSFILKRSEKIKESARVKLKISK